MYHVLISNSHRTQSGQCSITFDIDDTLIFDSETEVPNIHIKRLLDMCILYKFDVHLITAREKSDAITEWTRSQLRRHKIEYMSLSLAPSTHRTSMKKISEWKHATRNKFPNLILTVGDQWGDLIKLGKESDIQALDELHCSKHKWLLIQTAVGVYGLKTMAQK